MPARFDHAVVIVPSLKRAVQSFERLGFCVVPGGRTGPVHNALILFSDGTYIELTTNRFSVVRPVYRALNAAGLMGHVAAKRKDMLHRFLPLIGARQGAILEGIVSHPERLVFPFEIRLLCWLDRVAPWLTNWLFLRTLNQSRKDLEAP